MVANLVPQLLVTFDFYKVFPGDDCFASIDQNNQVSLSGTFCAQLVNKLFSFEDLNARFLRIDQFNYL